MKIVAVVFVVALLVGSFVAWKVFSAVGAGVQTAHASQQEGSFYALETETLEGEPISLDIFDGKVALVVNVASKCGLTPQYEGLEALYVEKKDQGLVVLGFPSSDFMNQEPGTPEEIREFCTKNYGVSFPMFAKRHVKGEDKDAVYQLLTQQLEEPTWNFTKYLVDAQGNVVYRFGPKTTPEDEELRAKIDELLTASEATQ